MATDYGNGSASDKGFHSGSVNEAKKITVDEKMVAEPLDEYGMPDKLKVTKSLVIRKAELMAKQYDTWFLKSLFLFSAFLCSFGYGLDGNIRGIYMT